MKEINKQKSLLCIFVLLSSATCLAATLEQDPVNGTNAQFRSNPSKPVKIEAGLDQPNVIFILADDMGWGDLACYGNPKIQTPRLDQMAAEGILFTQFYVQASVCSPTRVGFMTGMFPSRLAIHRAISGHNRNKEAGMPNWLNPNIPTITSVLQSEGYTTGHFGKWHLGSCCGAPSPSQYGIDDHVTTLSNGPEFPQQGDEFFRAESTSYIVDEGIEFIEANQDKPFYLNLWLLLPHATLHPTPEQLVLYENLAPNGVPYIGARQIYYASVTAMDEQIGRFLDRLDELGLSDNTLVVFASDNGPAHMYSKQASHSGVGSSGPFRGGKHSLYEGGIRMPMIARWPGQVPAGAVDNDTVISGVDFLPTFASLAGIDLIPHLSKAPPGHTGKGELQESYLDGEDMSGALFGSPMARTTPLFWEWRFGTSGAPIPRRAPMLAMRSGPWKLLMNPDWSRVELYDVVIDPSEVDNLADGYPNIVKALSASLLDWSDSLPDGPVAADAGSNEYPWPK